jgi:hypothetical protein
MDPPALPENRRFTPQEQAKFSRKMTPAQAQAARRRLEAFINSLTEAGVSVLDQAELSAVDGSAGLGATPVPLFSRGPSTRTGPRSGTTRTGPARQPKARCQTPAA